MSAQRLQVMPNYVPTEKQGLSSFEFLGKFGLHRARGKPYTYDTELEIPRLIDTWEVSEACRNKFRLKLSLPQDYHKFHKMKQHYFYSKFVCEYYKQERQKNLAFKLQKFVCFASRIEHALVTPYEPYSNWDFYAIKFQGSNFLWVDPQEYDKSAIEKNGDLFTSHGESFETMMTGYHTETTLLDLTNRKPFIAHERKFRSRSLLLLSDIDAQDSNNQSVELKLIHEQKMEYYPQNLKKSPSGGPDLKLVNLWSQCEVSDCKRVIIGARNDENQVVAFKDFGLEDIDFGWAAYRKGICYDFLDRLLQFIDHQVPNSSSESVSVKRFIYPATVEGKQDRSCVECVNAPDAIIPKGLVSALECMNN